MKLLNATPLDRKSGSAYRGRLAPSPTGYLHLGHARTFWIAQQRALAAGGTLILRNEDLDRDRSQPRFYHAMIEDLRWLGLEWQEGPDVGGRFGPYTQSERQGLYRDAWRRLLDGGWLYPCRCSRKDLAMAVQAPHDDEGIYPGTCRPATAQIGGPASAGQGQTGAFAFAKARLSSSRMSISDGSGLWLARTSETFWSGAGMIFLPINSRSWWTMQPCRSRKSSAEPICSSRLRGRYCWRGRLAYPRPPGITAICCAMSGGSG